MSKERELLAEFYAFIQDKPMIAGDVDSIGDMIQRYANPPLTMHYRAAMRMTITDTTRLQTLMRKARDLLTAENNPMTADDTLQLERIADDH